MKALKLRQGTGTVVIREDAIETVSCVTDGSRNISCAVNGTIVDEGFDFVLAALGWEIVQP